MPKHNPKRDKRPPPAPNVTKKDSKGKGSYIRRNLTHGRFYGLIIIAIFLVGIIILFYQLPPPDTRPAVAQWDHVQIQLSIWTIDDYIAGESSTSEPSPDLDSNQWYNFTTIYHPSTDTNTSVYTEGLPTKIFNDILNKHVGDSSVSPLYIEHCSDLDKNGYDDQNPSQPAEGWGFPVFSPPNFNQFINTTIIVTWQILNMTIIGMY